MGNEFASTDPNYIALTSYIVGAYVSKNHVTPGDLPALMGSVHATIAGLATGAAHASHGEPTTKIATSAQIRGSIHPKGLVSFINGKSYKTLKRHLASHGLDPAAYRERYGLPSDYPMTAQDYSDKRSNIARFLGLGKVGGGRKAKAAQRHNTREPQ